MLQADYFIETLKFFNGQVLGSILGTLCRLNFICCKIANGDLTRTLADIAFHFSSKASHVPFVSLYEVFSLSIVRVKNRSLSNHILKIN